MPHTATEATAAGKRTHFIRTDTTTLHVERRALPDAKMPRFSFYTELLHDGRPREREAAQLIQERYRKDAVT